MKKLIVLSVSLFFIFNISIGQVGITAGYLAYNAPDFNDYFENRTDLDFSQSSDLDGGNFQIAVDYWFRLEKKRVEFLPEISFAQQNAQLVSITAPDFGYEHDLTINTIQLNFNTQIYPFDFEGDCDCPTFSKDGDILKKGFFIRVAPGVSFQNYSNDNSTMTIGGVTTENFTDTGIAYNLRAGLGLDIGITDFITITPLAQYTFVSNSGDALAFEDPSLPVAANNFSWRHIFAGIRLGLRFDEMNKYGYR